MRLYLFPSNVVGNLDRVSKNVSKISPEIFITTRCLFFKDSPGLTMLITISKYEDSDRFQEIPEDSEIFPAKFPEVPQLLLLLGKVCDRIITIIREAVIKKQIYQTI